MRKLTKIKARGCWLCFNGWWALLIGWVKLEWRLLIKGRLKKDERGLMMRMISFEIYWFNLLVSNWLNSKKIIKHKTSLSSIFHWFFLIFWFGFVRLFLGLSFFLQACHFVCEFSNLFILLSKYTDWVWQRIDQFAQFKWLIFQSFNPERG